MKWIVAIACLVFACGPQIAQADDLKGWAVTSIGRTIYEGFPEAPYPYASRANGHTYQGKRYDRVGHYNDSTVGIFIPATFKPSSQGTNFIVHFHGWRNHVSQVLERYQLREQVEASGVNAILVVPQGPYDAPDSDDGRLEHEPGAFAALLRHVASFLHDSGITPNETIWHIVLTAHSGGYGGLSGVLRIGGLSDSVTDVVLFDAAYSKLDGFSNWVAGASTRRLVNVFTDDTISGNVELLSLVQKKHVRARVLMQADLTPTAARKRGAEFIYTPNLPHDAIMQKLRYYELFLKSSALPRN